MQNHQALSFRLSNSEVRLSNGTRHVASYSIGTASDGQLFNISAEDFVLPTDVFSESIAWYKSGGFSIADGTWPDASGTGNNATLSGSGLTTLLESGHGASGVVRSLSGTTSSQISFGDVIKEQFTVCSATRYTGGANQRILQGKIKTGSMGIGKAEQG